MTMQSGDAPGGPGVDPRWTSSAKSAVGTAMSARSMVWFTISHGIVNEVYHPRVDQANTRDMGLIVTAEPDFFAEEQHDTNTTLEMLVSGVPAYRIINTCKRGRFRIEKTVLTDPDRNVLLQAIDFTPLQGARSDYRLFVLLAPHLDNQGCDNSGWSGDYNGHSMLYAHRANTALALSCSASFVATSCGFVGVNDGWQQLRKARHLTECYTAARHGNIALCAELDLRSEGRLVLALAFGRDADEAAHSAHASLLTDFDAIRGTYTSEWTAVHSRSRRLATDDALTQQCKLSVTVLQTHEDKVRRGAFIASLSIPWGNDRGDHDIGGYHVIWPRDLVEIAGALAAAGHTGAACHALHYLMTTQNADGHWPQNMWLDGCAHWGGNQLDETAFPILLADQLRRVQALDHLDPWPMVRRAASYLARTGPVTPEDRWEEDGGYSSFTLAAMISALLAAADFADDHEEHHLASYLRDTADIWNHSIERWTYVTDTPLAKRMGVAGYYVRIAPPGLSRGDATIPLRNQSGDHREIRYSAMVSPDSLALVRFGLRKATDETILNTIRVIDELLRTETTKGPVWHRYNDDGYGEHEDGSPYDGTGIGRGWPLLAGERGHYEIAAGRADRARELLEVMRRQSGLGGLISEQVWDRPDIPERALFSGCPTGSAMPLAWAHAEFLKLARSIQDGRVFDTPPQPLQRYVESSNDCQTVAWRFNNRLRVMPSGHNLRVEARAEFVLHWTCDGWRTTGETHAIDTTIGMWIADLRVAQLPGGASVQFTFRWTGPNKWEGQDFAVQIDDSR